MVPVAYVPYATRPTVYNNNSTGLHNTVLGQHFTFVLGKVFVRLFEQIFLTLHKVFAGLGELKQIHTSPKWFGLINICLNLRGNSDQH